MKKKNNMHDPKEMRTNSSFLPNISTIHQLLYNLCTVTTVLTINIVPKLPSVYPKKVSSFLVKIKRQIETRQNKYGGGRFILPAFRICGSGRNDVGRQ